MADGAARLRTLGLDVDHWPLDLPALRAAAGYPGEEVDRTEAWGLVGTSAGAGPPALILAGHVDVVPPGDRRRGRATRIDPRSAPTTVTGRGSCDMKAGVAAMLAAAAAVRVSRNTARPAVRPAPGDRRGGRRARRLRHPATRTSRRRLCDPRADRISDWSPPTPAPSASGSRCPGLATHGSTRYAGSSALDSYLAIHAALQGLQRRRNRSPEPPMADYPVPYPLSVGSDPGRRLGQQRAGPADRRGPLRSADRRGSGAARGPSSKTSWRRWPPGTLSCASTHRGSSWVGGQFAGGALPSGHRLAELIGSAHADVTSSLRPTERGAPYGSDLRLYNGAGVPTLHYGPGDVRLAHGPNESVPIDQAGHLGPHPHAGAGPGLRVRRLGSQAQPAVCSLNRNTS